MSDSMLTSSISPVTVLSAAFHSCLPLGRSRNFALTIDGGIFHHRATSTVLRFPPSGCGYLPWTGLDGQYTGVVHRPRTAPDRSTKPFACYRGIYVPSSNDGPSCYFTDCRCFPRGQCVLIELSLIFTSLSLFPIFRCYVMLWDRHRILP
ncbi:hypothetical protein C8J57DRAFT_1304468 [Mycena rebaudengoi]|nr:hypothetical protein C8J57DRAFT_1304468 [Mycena rebaudengoi]